MSNKMETKDNGGTYLKERRKHSLPQRDHEFGSEYTDKRALRAFRSYRKLCDCNATLRKMTEAEKMYGESFDTRLQEKNGKLVRTESPEITDQEVPFKCESYEEAVGRVLELAGPIPIGSRNFHTARLDNNILKAVEYCGFSARLKSGERKGFAVSWRLDFDPEKKSHFNVIIEPPRNGVDVNPLNIAFVFPYDEDQFLNIAEATCRKIVINSFTQPEDQAAYIPRTIRDVQRIVGLDSSKIS